MSALGHYLEEEGLATVAISLIRPQTENTQPPRALWVPFELGRPFGPPSNPVFQQRVVLASLRLLERNDGPVLIEDFPDDDPRWTTDPTWQPPPVALLGAASPAVHLKAEVQALQESHRRWIQQHGRTTVGISGLSIEGAVDYVTEWLRGHAPESPHEGLSAPLELRFAVDDVKAYALEAAAAGAAIPSSRQLGDWLWNDSATGAAIHALRALLLNSEDPRLKLIAENFIVPGARVRAAA